MSEMSKRLKREEDVISKCPDDVMNLILLHLPIKEAVKTSVLSHTWRYKWHSLQDLVFDDGCYWGRGDWLEHFEEAVKTAVTNHPNPRGFELTKQLSRPSKYLNSCISTLSTKSVQEIILNLCDYRGFPDYSDYRTPSDLYKCRHLVRLKLVGCVLVIPPSFEGFMSLVTLYLDHVELPVDFRKIIRGISDSPNAFEIFISRCPRLQRLSLKNLDSVSKIDVEAPMLEWLEFEGGYLPVEVVHSPNLKSVTDGLDNTELNIYKRNTSLHRFLQAAPNLQNLYIERYSLKYLAVKKDELPPALAHLERLYTCIDFKFAEEVFTIMSLMRISPELKELEFEARPKEEERPFVLFYRIRDPGTRQDIADFWQESHPICCLEKVEIASLDSISGSVPELQFIRFLLKSLPNLKTVKIRLRHSMVEGKTPNDLLQFASVLTRADVLIF